MLSSFEDISNTISENKNVVVNFTAPSWCAPCRALKPQFWAAVDEASDDVLFIEVDIDLTDDETKKIYQIQSVPTVMQFVDGEFWKYIKSRKTTEILEEITY